MMKAREGNAFRKNAARMLLGACLTGSAILFSQAPCLAAAQTEQTVQTAAQANQNSEGWYWLSSDDKYSKFFDITSVVTIRSVNTSHGKVPTCIQAWTKTGYSPGGAKETIDSYDINAVIPDPTKLAYSYAQVEVNPQNRTIQYLEEDFYDAQGKILYSRKDGRVKEVNSQEFDEAFYNAVVDAVFKQGEMKRAAAGDRWIVLWKDVSNGIGTKVTADTTTMRMEGQNLIVWEWEEVTDANGNVLEIKFMKKAVNLPQGTERFVRGEYWSSRTGWQEMGDEYEGAYRMISEKAPEYKGLERLRAFATGYSTWVNRYSLD